MMEAFPAGQFRLPLAVIFYGTFNEHIHVGIVHVAIPQPCGLVFFMLSQKFHTEIVKVNRAGFHAFGTVLYQRLVFFDINILLISASLKKHESHKLVSSLFP